MILITGGAGFIGAHFILDWFALNSENSEGVINIDKLTYAANPDNFKTLTSQARLCFYSN